VRGKPLLAPMLVTTTMGAPPNIAVMFVRPSLNFKNRRSKCGSVREPNHDPARVDTNFCITLLRIEYVGLLMFVLAFSTYRPNTGHGTKSTVYSSITLEIVTFLGKNGRFEK